MLPACRISREGPRMYRPDHDCADLRATSATITKSVAIVIPHQAGGRSRRTRGRDSVGSDGHGSPRRSASVEDARSLAHQVEPGNTGNTEFIAHRWTEQRRPLRSTDGPCRDRPSVATDRPRAIVGVAMCLPGDTWTGRAVSTAFF